METQKIKKSIDITASKQMYGRCLKKEFNWQWYSEFSEGAYAKGELIEDGEVLFLNRSENGMIAK